MNMINKSILKISVFGALVAGGLWFYNFHTRDFRPSNIKMDLPHRAEWDIPPPNAVEKGTISQILSQNFSFLGKGNQVYAFESQDGQYVLKFFRFSHLKPGSWLSPLSTIPFIDRYIQKQERIKHRKLERIFNAYHLAYSKDRDHSGLLYVQLNPENRINQLVRVYDKLGISYEIDLNQTVFVLQHKAIPLRIFISDLFAKNDLSNAKKYFRDVIDMYIREYQRGIFDHDHNIMYNIGINKDLPMRIDIGKIVYDPDYTKPEVYREDLHKVVFVRIDKWLKTHFPEYREEIVKDLDDKLNDLREIDGKKSG